MQSIQASSPSFQCNFHCNNKCFLLWNRSTELLHTIMFLYKYRITTTTMRTKTYLQSKCQWNSHLWLQRIMSCYSQPQQYKTFNPNPIKPWRGRYDNQNAMIKCCGGYNGGFISITPYISLSVLRWTEYNKIFPWA